MRAARGGGGADTRADAYLVAVPRRIRLTGRARTAAATRRPRLGPAQRPHLLRPGQGPADEDGSPRGAEPRRRQRGLPLRTAALVPGRTEIRAHARGAAADRSRCRAFN